MRSRQIPSPNIQTFNGGKRRGVITQKLWISSNLTAEGGRGGGAGEDRGGEEGVGSEISG